MAEHFMNVEKCMAEAGFAYEYIPATKTLRGTVPSDPRTYELQKN